MSRIRSRCTAVVVEQMDNRLLLSAAPAMDVSINFQKAGPAPSGYLVDSGRSFGARGNGLRYGWDADLRGAARDRNAADVPGEQYDSFVKMQPRGVDHKWEIAVPKGVYSVKLAAGDPSPGKNASTYRVNVEGALVIDGAPNAEARWYEQSVVLQVSDGRITVSNADGAINNKLNYIEIHRLADDAAISSGVALNEESAGSDASLLRVAAAAAASSNDYNFNGATHNLQGIRLNKSNVPLYDGAGQPLGLYINNRPNDSFPNSALRFQGMEMLEADGGKDFYYTWGLGGVDGQSGHVHVSDMVARPSIDPDARGGSGSLKNGRTAPDIILSDGTKKSYSVEPIAIPSEMHYIGPSTGLMYHYDNYGTPATPYSSEHTPLSWSWINKTGGGIVRAQMKRGEVFYPANVSTITIASVDHNGATNGSVKAMYGSFWNGERRVFGWAVHSHIYQGVYTAHLNLLNG